MSKKHAQVGSFSKRSKTDLFITVVKTLMLAVYCYSVFFWGSVTLMTEMRGGYEGSFSPPAWVIAAMAAGWAALTAAMVLSFMKKEITAFVLSAGGTAAFLRAAGWFVSTISELLETRDTAADFAQMDREYIWRFFPSLAIPVLALIPAVRKTVRLIRKRKQDTVKKQSEPVKSIVD